MCYLNVNIIIICDSIAVTNEYFTTFALITNKMKVLFSIFLFMSALFITDVWVAIYSEGQVEFCLTDLQGEGKSDTDTSENSEDDAEFDSWNPETSNSSDQLTQKFHSNRFYIVPHFMEIPNPPPEKIEVI